MTAMPAGRFKDYNIMTFLHQLVGTAKSSQPCATYNDFF
jgi:hypothetical protein